MNDNLATIQKIKAIRSHTNAENLELADVLGWQVVVKKGEFTAGDLCVYIVIDTILPEKPEFEFLRNKNFRIKPIRLRGENSAGIVFPLSILPNYEAASGNLPTDSHFPSCKGANDVVIALIEGTDVSDLLGIKHYEKPLSAELAGVAVGSFPSYLIITDELNLRTYPDAIPEMYSRPFYITRKEDGSSGTHFIKDGVFNVCSRRIHLKENEANGFWRMARKYNVENALRSAFPNMNIAIQSEIIGPGIQQNKLGLKELEMRIFNLFDIDSRLYLGYEKLVEFTTKYNIPMVPLVIAASSFPYTLDELVKLANEQKYPTGGPAEGIVIRPQEPFRSTVLKKVWSGKVLNENYKE